MKSASRRPKQPGTKKPAGGVEAARRLAGNPAGVGSVCVFLVVLVWVVFGQTLGFEFVNYDDPMNVTENPMVVKGLSWRGCVWAFTHPQVGHWDPLTTISHMAVCQFSGLDPAGHHLTNVVLHAVSAILLFLLLRQMTGAHWRSALVAAVFAVHPLRVESVAWITERKDVLSGVFFLLTLWAYVGYVARPGAWGRYAAVVVLFALGLMCKAMLVTLPAVLLLLDRWPLGRFAEPLGDAASGRRARMWPLIREKLPLFALSAGACAVQLFSAQEMIATVEQWPLSWRLGNAAVSYVAYLGDTFHPAGLAVYYPHAKGGLPGGEIAAAVLLLVFATAGAWAARRRHPYFLTGWLWFVGMLVPVIGLVQSGTLARADRYMYLPHIGLSVAVVWLAWDLCAGLRWRRGILGAVAVAAVAGMVWQARIQASFWKDSRVLWTHTLAATGPNDIAENNLGQFYLERGLINQAEGHIRRALEIAPRYATAHANLGMCLFAKGDVAQAIAQFQEAVSIRPGFAEAHGNLGAAFVQAGRIDEAVAHFAKAVEIAPDLAALENNLAGALLLRGRVAEAVSHYEMAIALAPQEVGALRNLAWVRATTADGALRDGTRALALAQRANELTGGGDPLVLLTVAAAYAETGRFGEALAAAERAVKSPRMKGAAVERARQQMEGYREGRAWRE